MVKFFLHAGTRKSCRALFLLACRFA
jgi:hypothetical protein